MGSFKRAVVMAGSVALIAASLTSTGVALAQDDDGICDVGVSWNNFEQPRWAATDKPNMQATIEAGGGTYTDFDARLDSAQQQTDVETLINGGADVLILLAQNQDAAVAAIEVANNAGVPVIAYDRLIEDPGVLYVTFDNVGVGRAQAQAVLDKVPSGNYVLIKGDPGDPNASTFLPQGWDEAGLKAKVDAGEITIVGDQFTDGWKTETAQNNMEAIIDKATADGVTIDRSWPRMTARRSASSRHSRPRALPLCRSAARTATRATCRTWLPAGSTWTSGRTATSSARWPVQPRCSSARAWPWTS
jgi:D-xylose transport system substrate-binding protein